MLLLTRCCTLVHGCWKAVVDVHVVRCSRLSVLPRCSSAHRLHCHTTCRHSYQVDIAEKLKRCFNEEMYADAAKRITARKEIKTILEERCVLLPSVVAHLLRGACSPSLACFVQVHHPVADQAGQGSNRRRLLLQEVALLSSYAPQPGASPSACCMGGVPVAAVGAPCTRLRGCRCRVRSLPG